MEEHWRFLEHAYGSAGDIPGLLLEAETDLRPGHEPGTTWFKLWSALCHQEDIYTASYAAVPKLIDLAHRPSYLGRYEPIWLAANIELSRLEGRGPAFPDSLTDAYRQAIQQGLQLAQEAAKLKLNSDASGAYAISAVIFAGDDNRARELLDELE
jgi:hypothetical protein